MKTEEEEEKHSLKDNAPSLALIKVLQPTATGISASSANSVSATPTYSVWISVCIVPCVKCTCSSVWRALYVQSVLFESRQEVEI